MAQTSAVTAVLLATLLTTSLLLPFASAGGEIDPTFGWMQSGSGLLADDAGEFLMESEVTRRILATSRYISYQALRRGSTPCSVRGASYYNCRPGGQSNPYRRSCSNIARCRS